MRRSKLERMARLRAQRADYDADQGEVWREVREYATRRCARSETMALTEVVERDRGSMQEYVEAIPCRLDQTGLAAFIDGELASIDIVAEPKVYATLHRKLLESLAAEALDREPVPSENMSAPDHAAPRW